jgi:hypothetical protein
MSQNSAGEPRRRGRPPKPKSDEPKRPRGRPPKPKVDEDKDLDQEFFDGIKVMRTGRASLEYDQETLEAIFHCARRACSQAECASILGVSPSALTHFFQTYPDARDVWDRGLDVSRVKLRSIQLKIAEKNPIMGIWLGKQLLGQKDTVHQDITINKPANELTEEQLLEIAKKAG